MDMHMDEAGNTFWIKSQNGTFIALQMKSFGPKITTGKKVPFWQFFRKADMALFNLCMKI